MTSERQKTANRANALRSTGPKTPEGKAVVRLNALQHGLLAREVVLPGEDADAFEDLWNRIRADLSPVGPIEELLVDRIVNAMWRLQRLARAETALFHWRVHELKANRLAKQASSYEKTFLDELSFSAPEITDKASHAEATEALAQATYERDRDEVLLGRALDADAKEGDAFAKLARYETRIGGRFFGLSTSFAEYRTNARIVHHPRLWMPLRWMQKIPSDKLSTNVGVPAEHGPVFF